MFRHVKKYSIFLSAVSPPMTYGVLSISESLKDLLRLKIQIIYDGYIGAFNISFGGGIRGGLKDSYDQAKAAHRMVTTLPFEPKNNRQTDRIN